MTVKAEKAQGQIAGQEGRRKSHISSFYLTHVGVCAAVVGVRVDATVSRACASLLGELELSVCVYVCTCVCGWEVVEGGELCALSLSGSVKQCSESMSMHTEVHP
jgi:hypothetical protein